MEEKLYLIDATALIYRSYFAFINRPLINSKGQNTSALFGFAKMIIKLIDIFHPKYFALTFDKRKPTFRHKIYKEYKANRQKMPEELVEQLPMIMEFVQKSKIPYLAENGFEADDLIGTLAEKFGKDKKVIIISGDKDFYQLVSDNVSLFDPYKEKEVGFEQVGEKFGTTPDKVVDVLAMMGDSSDNVPGIPKIGPKTAIKLIQQYHSLENAINNADKIKSKQVSKNLKEFAKQGILSKKLVTIRKDAPLSIQSIDELQFDHLDVKNSIEVFTKYELNSLLASLSEGSFGQVEKKEMEDYHLVNNKDDFHNLLKELEMSEEFAVDLETTGCDMIDTKMVGCSFAIKPHIAYYVPVGHTFGENLDKRYVLERLKQILENPKKKLIGQNIKYDYFILQNEGIELDNLYFDTMIASYVINPSEHHHNLSNLSIRYLNHKMIELNEVLGKGNKDFSIANIKQAYKYACEDADITLQLKQILLKEIAERKVEDLFFNIEMPLIKVLAKMERNGVYIDKEFFYNLSEKIAIQIDEIAEKIYQLAGQEFNINSPQQLSEVLFKKLKIPMKKKTKTGYSTNINVLMELSKDYEIAEYLIEYRQLAKLKSTYIDVFPQLVNPKTNRIHSSFNQTVTATGRLSSSEPNLQNIPVRGDMGKELRKGFIPQHNDYVILSADYSQIELRVAAILSGDEKFKESFAKAIDIHTRTASYIFGIPESEINSDHRRKAKVINFGVLYGMGAHRVSNELKISHKEAQEFIDNYFNLFPKVKEFSDKVIEKARTEGYVSTMFGRRRYIPEINSKNYQVRSFAERTAINTPIQGTAADIMKIAMINIHNKIKHKDDVKMIIQIHDELVFEVKQDKIEEYAKLIKDEMENVLPEKYQTEVPLKVDIGIGKNWLDAH